MSTVKVLIVDDQEPFLDAARMVVEMTDGFTVVGEAADGAEAVALAGELRPDLVLMDVQMPRMNGIEAARLISAMADPPRIVLMSTHESGDYEGPALDAGAFAFIPKSDFGLDALAELWTAGRE